MRTLAIGDVHGCSVALDVLLDAVALKPGDRLVTLGDYVDRGPDSRGVLDRLIALHTRGQLIALRGNHDQMMLEARSRFDPGMWLACGGVQALASYGVVADPEAEDVPDAHYNWFENLGAIPEAHWDFLENVCRKYHEIDTHFFVHATVDPDLPLAEQPDHLLYWEKLNGARAHVSGKVMVCGHTRQADGRPLNLGHVVCIDTGVYASDGWLTCLDVGSGKYWQANQRGEQRSDWLEPPDEVRRSWLSSLFG